MHPFLIPTVREEEQAYMKTFKPYTDEGKDRVIDALKGELKGVTVLTSTAAKNEHVSDHAPIQVCEAFVSTGKRNIPSTSKNIPSTSNDGNVCQRVASLERSVMEIVAFIRDEKLRRIEKNKKKQGKLIYILLLTCVLFV